MKARNFESVPYLSYCNVSCIRSVRVIPTQVIESTDSVIFIIVAWHQHPAAVQSFHMSIILPIITIIVIVE